MNKAHCGIVLKRPLVVALLTHCYMIISVINIIGYFCWDTIEISLYTFLGNHSILLYPYWGMIIASDLEAKWLLIGLFVYWISNVFLFMFAYIVALTRKRYCLFKIVVFIDAVFSLLFAIANWINSGFLDLHITIISGALIDLLFVWYLQRYGARIVQKN